MSPERKRIRLLYSSRPAKILNNGVEPSRPPWISRTYHFHRFQNGTTPSFQRSMSQLALIQSHLPPLVSAVIGATELDSAPIWTLLAACRHGLWFRLWKEHSASGRVESRPFMMSAYQGDIWAVCSFGTSSYSRNVHLFTADGTCAIEPLLKPGVTEAHAKPTDAGISALCVIRECAANVPSTGGLGSEFGKW